MTTGDETSRPRLLLCDCGRSMSPDPGAIGRACAVEIDGVHTGLCRHQIERFAAAVEAGGEVTVACVQEAPVFAEVAEDAGAADRVRFVDIRDRAGWSDDGANAQAKMAALIAEARVRVVPTPGITLRSDGVALVYGPGEVALEAGRRLADRLAVTVMMSDDGDAIAPAVRAFPIVRGRIVAAEGWLGAFQVTVDGFARAEPSGRGALAFEPAENGMVSDCDLIVDLSGGAPLFAAHDRRDGYLRAEPGDAAGIARAMFEATGFVGEFEKPLYVDFEAALCAHSRSGQPGCTRCLDVCPTSAITPAGDTVAIDPHICAGCGACASVCPSGAATYAFPEPVHVYRRLEALFGGWRGAGGGALRLLVHDEPAGEVIAMSARYGRGLPADVVPFALNQVTQTGHELVLAALAMGAAEVIVLLDPRRRDEADALNSQLALANVMTAGLGIEGERARLVETIDPDALEDALWREAPSPIGAEPITPLGNRRSVTRLAVGALAAAAGHDMQPIALPGDLFPSGPPYGRVIVDTGACTLCLACASTCPAGALLDNPDSPQLRFHEDACLQCGICVATCPENAISLEARYLPGAAARQAVVLHEEEPFACIECGKPFGVRSSIERIAEKLVGKHWMFADSERARLIQMCDDCRIRAQYHVKDSPFRMGTERRVRTTDDYLAGRAGETDADDDTT